VIPAPDVARLLCLEGQAALVTGAGGGIGSAIASLLLRAGARVGGVDLPGVPPPAGVDPFPCDVSDPAMVRDLLERAGAAFGRLDVLVHAAGIVRDAVVWKMEDGAWSGVLRANLDSGFLLLREAVPRMRQRGGSIVLVASINGERGKFGQANYAASKAGLIALARTAAREVGRFGVRVNVISPGWIETPMTAGAPEEARRRAIAESALGRTGQPDDVARATLFLASDLARHVTGQVLRVDGGQHIG
jgi:acetoacetyl-CoA reductase/3-oxoacyl-[acyl-carrier protein] reductase